MLWGWLLELYLLLEEESFATIKTMTNWDVTSKPSEEVTIILKREGKDVML